MAMQTSTEFRRPRLFISMALFSEKPSILRELSLGPMCRSTRCCLMPHPIFRRLSFRRSQILDSQYSRNGHISATPDLAV